jgi:restriction endonuclease S subunit
MEKSGIAKGLKNNIGFGSSEFIVLRSSDRIIPELVYSFVSSEKFREIGKPQMTGTGGLQRLPTSFISKFQIPLPPLDVQQEIVAELERYQKIIDGAKQVVENYKPSIKINPTWEKEKLGNLFRTLEAGVSVNSESRPKNVGEKGILKTSAVTYGVFNPLEHKAIVKSEINRAKVTPKRDNIIISRMNTPLLVGASAYIEEDWDDLFLPDRLWQTVRSREDYSMKFVFYMISSSDLREVITGISGGTSGSMKNISKEAFLNIEIPLPSFETQKEIVEKIEAESALVDSTKQLIKLYEQKVKVKISEVWGELEVSEAEDKTLPQLDLSTV